VSIEALKPQLEALTPDQLRTPGLPMAAALQEAHDLLTLCHGEQVKAALIDVGQDPQFTTDLEQRLAAAREAQSQWVAVRDRTKSTALVGLEGRAATLRRDLLAAGRFNLRRDREAQAVLSAISQGETVADLVQDLLDLATLFEQHAAAFASDQSFDVAAGVAEAREVAQALSASVSDERLDPEPSGTRELRDRAFTYLDDLVSEIRAAGRYAFRREVELARRFTSRHRRRLRRTAKRGGPREEVVEQVVEE